MDGFDLERNGLSPDHIHFSGEEVNLSLTLTEQNNNVVVVGLSQSGFGINTYLDEEGFRVVLATPEEALETIRWEQPAFALIEGGLHGEASFDLLRRLDTDILTRNITLLIWVAEAPAEEYRAAARRAFYIDNFDALRLALRGLQAARLPRPKPELSQRPAPPFVVVAHSKQAANLRKLLVNPRLRKFVDEVIDGWSVLCLAAYLGEYPDAVVNVEMLCYQFELDPVESARAIQRLAQAGYLEPLEFDAFDPIYAPVAHRHCQTLLAELGAALKVPEYRMALATLILARERTVK